MPIEQGDLSLLNEPVAQELLNSTNLARLAYVWRDGTPRVVPVWFYWNGAELILGSPAAMPKVAALQHNPKVAVTIDDQNFPWKVLLVRGTARVELVEGVAPEYVAAAKRYFGQEQGQAWADQLGQISATMGRIAIQPEWVGLFDFETRFPGVIQAAMDAQPA